MENRRRNRNPLDSAPRIERKIIEKNRRTRMKALYSNLVSLLPNHTSKVEGLPLPDQIDEAVEHIENMKKKLEILTQKKELLLLGKRPTDSCINSKHRATNKRSPPPHIEVHDMGPNLDVVLANGLRDYSAFHDIIRCIHQHGVEIAGAGFARDGNSSIQVLQDKVGQSKPGFEGEAMSRKLKELVSGTSSGSEVMESHELNLWDFEIDQSNIWGFEIPHVLAASSGTNFGYYEEFLDMGNLFNM